MSNRLISLLTTLIIAAGLLVSCVPVPMEDVASRQAAVAPAQRASATPLPHRGRHSDCRADAGTDRVAEGSINRDRGRSNQYRSRPADGHEQAQ